jgi:predicted DNA-binding protein
MLTIRLSKEMERRLGRLAQKTGRTIAAIASEAIREGIDDLEDRHLAEARASRKREAIPLADVERKLELPR